jgi:hypothetical protein
LAGLVEIEFDFLPQPAEEQIDNALIKGLVCPFF